MDVYLDPLELSGIEQLSQKIPITVIIDDCD